MCLFASVTVCSCWPSANERSRNTHSYHRNCKARLAAVGRTVLSRWNTHSTPFFVVLVFFSFPGARRIAPLELGTDTEGRRGRCRCRWQPCVPNQRRAVGAVGAVCRPRRGRAARSLASRCPHRPEQRHRRRAGLHLIEHYITIGFEQLAVKEDRSGCSHFRSNGYAHN